MNAQTPEELESLLEDAVVLHDAPAVAGLFEAGGVLVARHGEPAARGALEVERATLHLWRHGYVADPRTMLGLPDLTLATGPRAITVARRSTDGIWRYAFAVFHGREPEGEGW